jgi:hypothetical protein
VAARRNVAGEVMSHNRRMDLETSRLTCHVEVMLASQSLTAAAGAGKRQEGREMRDPAVAHCYAVAAAARTGRCHQRWSAFVRPVDSCYTTSEYHRP